MSLGQGDLENIYRLHMENLAKLSGLEVEIKTLHVEVTDLKQEQKMLMQFMHKIEGGKAWFFSILTVSAALGATLSGAIGFMFHK